MGWVLGRVMGSSGCGASNGEEKFTDHDFVDDAVIFVESTEAPIRVLERLSEESECLGLWVSWIKSKIQAFNYLLDTVATSLPVCGKSINLFERFIYLGSDIQVSVDFLWSQ